jgi:hypothetical protein
VKCITIIGMDNMPAGMYLDVSGEWRPENPKLAGSSIVACRPQVGPCLGNCADCFFKGGRYYEDINVAHIPDPLWVNSNHLLVRMNDGNDSNYERDLVMAVARKYARVFFNTRVPRIDFDDIGPVVFTVNGEDTDLTAVCLTGDLGALMTVRVRVNTWNLPLVRQVIDWYLPRKIPVRLTYMAYYQESVREPDNYEWRKRTLNSYWCIQPEVRARIERELGYDDEMIHACTKAGGEGCRDCGKCLKIYEQWGQKT